MQHEGIRIDPELRHDERDSLRHQVCDEGDVAREPVELRNHYRIFRASAGRDVDTAAVGTVFEEIVYIDRRSLRTDVLTSEIGNGARYSRVSLAATTSTSPASTDRHGEVHLCRAFWRNRHVRRHDVGLTRHERRDQLAEGHLGTAVRGLRTRRAFALLRSLTENTKGVDALAMPEPISSSGPTSLVGIDTRTVAALTLDLQTLYDRTVPPQRILS